MRNPTVFEGAIVAFAGSLSAGALWALLEPLVPGAVLLRVLIAAVGLAYLIYTLVRSRIRVGRVAAGALWVLASGALAVFDPPLLWHLLAQLALIWVVRTWCYYTSTLLVLADFGLGVLSLGAGVWASAQSGSLFLATWSLLLVQALFVILRTGVGTGVGARVGRGIPSPRALAPPEDSFDRAHRSAEAALRKLSTAR